MNNQDNNMNGNMNNINNNVLYPTVPIKTIKNYNINKEVSYINSVLQSLISIDCIKNWLNNLRQNNIMNNVEDCLTKDFYQLYCLLLSGQDIDSTNVIFHFSNRVKKVYKKDIKKDPFHFLYYFLELLHLENNSPLNSNFDLIVYNNQIRQNLNNDNINLKLFCDYFQQTQNSIISNNFFNSLKFMDTCFSCSSIYCYECRMLIVFDLDELKKNLQNGGKIALDKCFELYYKEKQIDCKFCEIYTASRFEKIFTTTKALIIAFKRKNHTYKGDIDFNLQLSMSNYAIQNENINNKNYILKAIISYCSIPKYFADIKINDNWYRFIDHNNPDSKRLKNIAELYRFEPQILIYELEEDNKADFINPISIIAAKINNGNNSIIHPNQLMQMQMKELQNKNINNRIDQNYKLTNVQANNNNNINNIDNNNNNNINNNIINNNINNNGFNNKSVNMNFNNNFNIDRNNNEINKNNNKTDSRIMKWSPFNNNSTFNNNNNLINNKIVMNIYIIPENWDQSYENALKVIIECTLDDTFEKLIYTFFTKLQKPREAIKIFIFNGNEIRSDCKLTLRNLGITENSQIFAIKNNNF